MAWIRGSLLWVMEVEEERECCNSLTEKELLKNVPRYL